MCGIVGTVQVGNGASLRAQVCSAMRMLVHRGPDDGDLREFTVSFRRGPNHPGTEGGSAKVLLGHRRLSIIDLSGAARQPMSTADGRYHLLFNGEIYNYRELRVELEQLGWRFRTMSDTEVLLAGYAVWGDSVLQRIVGMFSFAVLDSLSATLFVARDPFGIKPFYYACRSGWLVFASEIKPLLEFPGISRRVNPRQLQDFMVNGVCDRANGTLFADILQLPAAHHMHISCEFPDRASPVPYWTLAKQAANASALDAPGKFRELFQQSVRLHLRSDVPVGVSLSGGLDSSAIAVMARQLNGAGHAIHAISYIADDPSVCEERWCNLVARTASLHQHQVHITPEQLAADFQQLVRVQEHPFGSPTIYAQYCVYRAAKDAGLKVMLSGQGADQYLGGYNPHVAVRVATLLRSGKWWLALRLLRRISSLPAGQYVTTRALARHLLPEFMARALSTLRPEPSPMVNHLWFRERGITPRSATRSQHFRSLHDLLHRTLFETQLPTLLRVEDRNAMAFSIENRVPFLIPALVEFVFSRPEDDVIGNDGFSKSILLRAMSGLLPADVLERRDKIGFDMPMQKLTQHLAPWLRGVLKDVAIVPALNAAQVLRQGENAFGDSATFAAQLSIWRWISLIAWAREFQVCFE